VITCLLQEDGGIIVLPAWVRLSTEMTVGISEGKIV
jgi:hypothetical protein